MVYRFLAGWKMVIGMVYEFLPSRLGTDWVPPGLSQRRSCCLVHAAVRPEKDLEGLGCGPKCFWLGALRPVASVLSSDPIVVCVYFSPQLAVRSIDAPTCRCQIIDEVQREFSPNTRSCHLKFLLH